jgi:hypothetical protein
MKDCNHKLAARLVQVAYSFTDGTNGRRLTDAATRIALFEAVLREHACHKQPTK